MRLARARHKRGARAAFPRRAANHRPTGTRRRTGTNCEGGRHIRHDRQRPNGGNDIPSARQEGTPRRKRPANREICPVARPEHATGEFIPVDGKKATERALDGLCISSMDVSLFAGHSKRDAEDGACKSFPILEIMQDGQKRPPSATGGTNEKQNSPVIRQNCPVDSAERETRTSLPMSNPNGLRSENKPVPYFPRRAPRPPSAQLPRNPR